MKKTNLLFLPLLFPLMSSFQASNEDYLTYNLDPNPQSIDYLGESTFIEKNISLFTSPSIDVYTKQRVYEAFKTKDVLIKENGDSNFKITLSTYEESSSFSSLISKDDYSSILDKKDSYCLKISDKNITIFGKDTNAVYYGLATLSQIVEQSEDKLSSLFIKDYSNSTYRGFIEGYYGIPWTKDERIELIKFSKIVKGNIYIYAPKDDSYHSTNWRGLYDKNSLSNLKEVIEVAKESKVSFTYSIHPFLYQAINASNYDSSLTSLKNKFDQLYEAGVRSFAISADDIGIPEGTLYEDGSFHKRLLIDVNNYLKEKGDCSNLIFVPSAYCYQAETRLRVDLKKYYSTLISDLPLDIEIMWTGDDVCTYLTSLRYEEFSSITNGRKPFYWLNWPVNDYSTSHLLMGKAEVLNKSYEDENIEFSGIVTNPMQQAEPSKISIYSICSYCWNTSSFNASLTYTNSFKYIEKNKGNELEYLCSYLTNANLYEGRYFEESKDLSLLISSYKKAYEKGDFAKESAFLTDELNKVVNYATSYLENAENKELSSSISPWINSLLYSAKLCISSLNTILNHSSFSSDEHVSFLETVTDLENKIANCKAPVLNKITYNIDLEKVDVGVVILTPFLNEVVSLAKDISSLSLGRFTGVTYSGFDSIYSGSLSNITDDDDSTYCWFSGTPKENAYVRVDLGEIKTVNDVKILFGNANGATDYMVGKAQYSLDGFNFSDIGELNGANNVFDLRDNPIEARFIRILNVSTSTWVSVKEIAINKLDPNQYVYSIEGIELEPSVETKLEYMGDKDLSTYTWFGINKSEVTSIVLDLRQLTTINNIVLYQAKSSSPSDFFQNVSFYVSSDGTSYTQVGDSSYVDKKEINIDLSSSLVEARYVKLVNNGSSPYGIVIREFNVNCNF